MLPRAEAGGSAGRRAVPRGGQSPLRGAPSAGSLFQDSSRAELSFWASSELFWLLSPFLLDLPPPPPLLCLPWIWWHLIRTNPFGGTRALGCPIPSRSQLWHLQPPGTWRTMLWGYSLCPWEQRLEGQDQVLRRGERGLLSLSRPSLHFNQGLRYKILLFRAFQLWNLKHPHALSQLLLQ